MHRLSGFATPRIARTEVAGQNRSARFRISARRAPNGRCRPTDPRRWLLATWSDGLHRGFATWRPVSCRSHRHANPKHASNPRPTACCTRARRLFRSLPEASARSRLRRAEPTSRAAVSSVASHDRTSRIGVAGRLLQILRSDEREPAPNERRVNAAARDKVRDDHRDDEQVRHGTQR